MTMRACTDVLLEARVFLQREFPEASLYEVRVEFREGERHDFRPASETWTEERWTVQIDNDHGYADSFENALGDLQRRREQKVLTRELAEKVVDALLVLPEEGARHDVMRETQNILDNRRHAR